MQANGLFLNLKRKTKPLTPAIRGELMVPAFRAASCLTQAELDGRGDAEIALSMMNTYWLPPSIGEAIVSQPTEGERHSRQGGKGGGIPSVPSKRFEVRWEVEGNAEWLDYRPDNRMSELPLASVDEIYPPPDPQLEVEKADWNRLNRLSGNLYLRMGNDVASYVEVPRDISDPRRYRDDQVAERTRMLQGSWMR